MGQKQECWNCNESFDTGRYPNPYGVQKEKFKCPNCGRMNDVIFNPFE